MHHWKVITYLYDGQDAPFYQSYSFVQPGILPGADFQLSMHYFQILKSFLSLNYWIFYSEILILSDLQVFDSDDSELNSDKVSKTREGKFIEQF